MPEISISVGGHIYRINCEPGEETAVKAAAELLDQQVKAVGGDANPLTKTNSLLMAGLLLADVAKSDRERAQSLETQLRVVSSRLHGNEEAEIPQELGDRLAALAVQAEETADRAEAASGA